MLLGPHWRRVCVSAGSRYCSQHHSSQLLRASVVGGAPPRHQHHHPCRAMSSEEAAAKAAAAAADGDAPTLFDKIVSKQIPAAIIYEDDQALAFKDINPQAPTHFLVIPKARDGLTRLSKMQEGQKALVGHLMYVAQLVAKQEGLLPGFRVVVNDGPDACQSVYHLHLHVIGGRQLKWPPG